jgi:eukaryotic-like serine/threonine-protein kinase
MLAGKQLGPFRVEHELGSGAMGTVYRGVESKTGKLVAIKIISIGLSGNDRALERFLREVNVLKKLRHPNIARYLGSGRYHGTPFYIMEFLDGESLDKLLERRTRLPWEDVAAWGVQLCEGLQYAHKQGIIHRDLKPSNVMLLTDGTAKLTDFGIAKDAEAAGLTATHSTVGTAAYMSPEQCRGAKDITYKSDLYSLGILFYELITGHKPFDADNPMDIFQMHVRGKCARPSTYAMDLPIWFDTLILHLMEKDPAQRPLDASKVREELESIERRVTEQKSAAVERATKRRADRTTLDGKLDETDREIARTLLGKKKKKVKVQPFYTKNWFTASAGGGLLLALAIGVWFLLQPPSADTLYKDAEKKMASGSIDDHREAAREPIRLFLDHYPFDLRKAQMIAWRSRYELEDCQRCVRNDIHVADDPGAGWAAVTAEREGRLDDAVKSWEKVVPLKDGDDSDRRGWGLLAEKSLRSLREADEIFARLSKQLGKKSSKKEDKSTLSDPDRLTLDVLAAMEAEDRRAALLAVDELQRSTENNDDQRAYWLLAKKLRRDRDLQ